MIVHVERKRTSKCFLFEIAEEARYIGKANFTAGILLRKLEVRDKIKEIKYVLQQENIPQRVLGCLPFMNYYPRPHYEAYINGEHCGRTRSTRKFTQTICTIASDTYELVMHGNNYLSVLKNDVQIALIHRNPEVLNEVGRYTVDYDPDGASLPILLLFIAYCDVVWFPVPLTCYKSRRMDKGIHLSRHPFSERMSWTSSDNPDLK